FYWEFAVSCDTLLYISMSFEFPLASLAAKLIPVVGVAVSRGIKWLEKKLDTGLFVRVTVGAGFGLRTALARDQHGTFINDGSGTAAIIKAELGLALVARVVGLTGDVGLKATGEVTIGMTPPQREGYFMRVALDGLVQVFFECSLQYKGKFSCFSTFTAWVGDAVAGDYVTMGDKDRSGKRTVGIKYSKKIMEWNPQPIGKEFIKLSERKA
ncbi:MAG: LysR family transcriptional regulator, partial [Deltaproteobacteria bacterium]|nr:LysR family transcriptional regulator [Deltaproteobacteria bacterium]